MDRRLAAIMAADLVGYSKLIRADEEGTLTALNALRANIIDPILAKHKGRIVKLMGDGMLVEFPSVVDAVRAALQAQQTLATQTSAQPEGKLMQFRIGINLGDVVIDGDDIHGDDVNVAARLEAMAEPGGICISGVVYEGVRDRIDHQFDDMGQQVLKNIDRPVRVWSWQPGSKSSKSRSSAAKKSLPLPDKPSIAVLPFQNMNRDAEQEYFSDGITEDIITALSHIRQFFVIARNTSFTFKGRAVDVQAVARELGVRYVLEGSVRTAGKRVRISAQLIDGTTGNHLWADRYDRELKDVFEVQDEITQVVVGALGPELSRAEQARARLKAPESMDAWDNYQRGHWHMWRFNRKDNAEARALFQRAIQIDPNLSTAFAAIAFTHTEDFFHGYSDDPASAVEDAMKFAQQALKLDDREVTAYVMRGVVNLIRRDHASACNDLKTALKIVPSNALALMVLGATHAWSNKPDEALPYFDEAERISPKDPVLWLSLMGRSLAHLVKGEFENAVSMGKRAIAIPNVPIAPHQFHVAALGHLGRHKEAKAAVDAMLQLNPDFRLSFVEHMLPTNDETVRTFILDGLRKAGL